MKKKIMNEQQRLDKIINRLVKESITDLSNMYNEESEDNDYNSNESSDDETEKERKVRISVEKELKKPGINIAPYAYKLEGLSISDSNGKEGDDNEHKNARSKLYKKLNHKPDSNGNPQYLSPEEALHLKNELSNTLSESKKMDITMSDLCYMVNESVKKVLQEGSDDDQWRSELKAFMRGLRNGDYFEDNGTVYVQIWKKMTAENDPRYVYFRKGDTRLHDDHYYIQNSPRLSTRTINAINRRLGWNNNYDDEDEYYGY